MSAGLLLLLAIGLVPALVGTLWTLNHTRDVALREAFGQADLLATGTAERLHWQLQDAQAMMAAVAERPKVKALDASDCDPIFHEFRSVSPSYRALALRRLDGTSVCSELKNPPSQQAVAAAPWFQVAAQQAAFHASDGHRGSVDQPWAARLTHPVLDATGRRVGVLVTPVDLKQLQQRLFARMPAQATAAVVDGSNRVLVRSQRQDERMGKPAAEGVARVLDEMRRAAQGQDRSISQSRQFVEVGIGGVRNLFVVRTVPLSDWAVVCALPEEQTLAAYHASRQRSLAAIVVVVLLAGLAAWRVSRAILVPIRGLSSAARSMASGETEPRAPETGPREIREVAREFNRMVQVTAESREQLRASESQYRTLIQNLPVAVLSYTAEGRVEVFNDRTCTLLHTTPAQLQGGTLKDTPWRFVDDQGQPLQPGADPASRLLDSRQPLAPETLGIVESEAERQGRVPPLPQAPAPGAHTWVMVTGYPQFDAQGHLLRAIVVMVDVTKQRQAEHLHMAKEAAEAASKAKSAFLSRVSHELRTPLNAINGFSELLLSDERLAVDVKGKLGHVLNAGRHLLSLIEQILDLSRVESGQIQPSMQPVALWPLLEECVAICGPLAHARQVTLSLCHPAVNAVAGPADLWVKGDATRLRQVVMNLLSNGIKYNRPEGRVTVQVRTLATGPVAAPDLVLDIVDTGAGLSPLQLQGLFQPFNRLGAESRGIEGHGLGLLISRLLAQSMGGDLTVSSTVNVGSCFSVHLHRCAAPDQVAPPPVVPGMQLGLDSAPAGPTRPLRVLYIEDNELNMLLMRQIVGLRKELEFFEATDGLAGVRAVQQLRPDLVLVDIGLPLLDGFGVLEQLRAAADTADIPCWAVTADTTPETAERARRSGFDRHLTKPLAVSTMLSALDEWARARAHAHLPPLDLPHPRH